VREWLRREFGTGRHVVLIIGGENWGNQLKNVPVREICGQTELEVSAIDFPEMRIVSHSDIYHSIKLVDRDLVFRKVLRSISPER